MLEQLTRFLREEMGMPAAEIAIAQRFLEKNTQQHPERNSYLLPMVLWQYGLLTLEQLDRLFDWLERA
jgi:hypothetical protein